MWNIFVGNCEIWKYRIMISSQLFLKKNEPQKVNTLPLKKGMVGRPFSFCSSKRQLLNYGGWLFFETLTVPNSSKKGEHIETKRWLIPSWWCFKYPVVSSRKSKGYTLHNHPKDQFPNHLFGWLDFQGKHHCHLPEMNWCFTVLQTKTSLSCHYNCITTQKNQQPKHKLSSKHFFLGDKFAQNPNQTQNSVIPTKNQPTLGSSYSRQPPSKTNICRGVSFRSVASQDPARWRRGRAWVGWLFLVGSIWRLRYSTAWNSYFILIKSMVLEWNAYVFL